MNINDASSTLTTLFLPSPSHNQSIIEASCRLVNFSTFQFRADDSKDLISARTSSIFNNVVRIVLIPALFFIGFPSNLVNMAVFFKHGLKQRINLCLFCLSLIDLMFVTCAFLVYVEKLRYADLTVSSRTFGYFTKILIENGLFGCYSGAGYSTEFISAVIAGERCLCVMWPLRANTVLKTRTLGAVLLLGVLLLFAGRVVVAMKYDVLCVVDAATGVKSFLLTSGEYYRVHKKLVNILDGTVYSLVIQVTNSIFVIVTTALAAANLHKSAEFQKQSSSVVSSAQNVGVSRMLICLSVQFLTLTSINMLFRVAAVFLPELSTTGDWANLFFFLAAIPGLCGVLNSSLKFWVYYLFGSKYRSSVRSMFFCTVTKAASAKHSPSGVTAAVVVT